MTLDPLSVHPTPATPSSPNEARNGTKTTLDDHVEVRDSPIHGRGVFARRHIAANQPIGRYAGRRHDDDSRLLGLDDSVTYLFGLSDGSVIDGARGGNATRHINHSCEPNVMAEEVRGRKGRIEIVFVALRDLLPGEELLIDYALQTDADEAAYACRCASVRCRGTMAAGNS